MHDIDEGVSNYVMTNLLLTLIDDKLFDINFVNDIKNSMNFDYEKNNVPENIKLEYVRKNKHLKMSASELLFFARYFGLMVGDRVPKDHKVWLLYTKLREILYVINAPDVTEQDVNI